MASLEEIYQMFLAHPSVQTDTRRLQAGDLFFALKGPNFNGNRFAQAALDAGAAFVFVDEALDFDDPRCVRVPDVLTLLQELARHHRRRLNIPVIAITGSNGKTTTKELAHAVLAKKYNTLATKGNLNNHIGVPLTLLRLSSDTEIAIIEMGANHLGEIASYCEVAEPDFGLITNCGMAHLEGFGSVAGVRQAKGELYDSIRHRQGCVFRDASLDYLSEMAEGISCQITYGESNARVIGRQLSSAAFLKVALLTAGMETTIQTKLVGGYNLPNVLAAVAIGYHFKLPVELIRQALEEYEPGNSRSQWIEQGDNRIILDAYNANPSSMQAALRNFATIAHENKWVLLGGMKELGAASVEAHSALVDLAKSLDLSNVLLCGAEFAGCRSDFPWFSDVDQLNVFLRSHPIRHALILVKGSRGTQMEQALSFLG